MKVALILGATTCVLAFGLNSLPPKAKRNLAESRERTPVIVELFTSEGCSSCPPADATLAKLEQDQPIDGAEVIALEEHVDYWNGLGWTDRFSSPQFTERQRDYASHFSRGSSYTPQMIVDGQSEFVGSHEQQAMTQISRASEAAKAKIILKTIAHGDGMAKISLSIGDLPDGTSGHGAGVWLAVTERGLHSQVGGGENSGEDLHHAAVVRRLERIGNAQWGKEPAYTGDFTLKLEPAWQRDKTQIVVFVQDSKTHRVVGAAVSELGR